MNPVLPTPLLHQCQPWQALLAEGRAMREQTLAGLFTADPQRGQRFSVEAAGLYLDYAKQRVGRRSLALLMALAEARGVLQRAAAMFAGEAVNTTEGRPALHTALRRPKGQPLLVAGRDITAPIQHTLERMGALARQMRAGKRLGHTQKPIRNVVNIGMGGSDLGPRMACHALRAFRQPGLNLRFVANADGADLKEALHGLDAAETLFIVCSKSFGTLETLTNAKAARLWCAQQLGSEGAVAQHFVAVSANVERVRAFGIDAEHTFELWDWVGGRYSMASAVGLPIMMAVGPAQFANMLAGMHAMDEHFRTAAPLRNMPLLMGMLAVWNTNFLGTASTAVIPYCHDLRYFPAYLQQLTMESNGKQTTVEGQPVSWNTGPVYWGAAGTNGQHSFHQLLHQGTQVVPCDFIGFANAQDALQDQHHLLIGNMIAQSEALAFGKSAEQVRAEGTPEDLVPHRICPGNRPSSTLLAQQLTPRTLGALVALYEHSVFTQATIWGINPFDQWGVELGKQLATRTTAELSASNGPQLAHDSSTNALIRRYRAWRKETH